MRYSNFTAGKQTIFFISFFLLLFFAITGCTYQQTATTEISNSTTVLNKPMINSSILDALLFIFAIGTPIVIVWVFAISKSWLELTIGFILVIALLFYYALPIAVFLTYLTSYHYLSFFATQIVNFGFFLLGVQRAIINIIPESQGYVIFGRIFFEWSIRDSFFSSPPTYLPILGLYSGLIIKFAINRFVPNEKLKQVAQEYWLFITTYIILAIIISAITTLSFWGLVVALLLLVFFSTAGVVRVLSDLIKGLASILELIFEIIKTIAMYVAIAATKFSKLLRRIIKRIVEFYEIYIVKPLQGIYDFVASIVIALQEAAEEILKAENLDE